MFLTGERERLGVEGLGVLGLATDIVLSLAGLTALEISTGLASTLRLGLVLD